MIWEGARDMDLLLATNAITEPRPIRRRHVGQAVARWIVTVALVAAAMWFVSDGMTAALLDEQRLAMLGIV